MTVGFECQQSDKHTHTIKKAEVDEEEIIWISDEHIEACPKYVRYILELAVSLGLVPLLLLLFCF